VLRVSPLARRVRSIGFVGNRQRGTGMCVGSVGLCCPVGSSQSRHLFGYTPCHRPGVVSGAEDQPGQHLGFASDQRTVTWREKVSSGSTSFSQGR